MNYSISFITINLFYFEVKTYLRGVLYWFRGLKFRGLWYSWCLRKVVSSKHAESTMSSGVFDYVNLAVGVNIRV